MLYLADSPYYRYFLTANKKHRERYEKEAAEDAKAKEAKKEANK